MMQNILLLHLEDLDDNLNLNSNTNSRPNINPMTQSKFPMNISVLNISKVFKRDKRNYDALKAQLMKSNEEEMPKIEHFIQHQTDKVIKPIIGNKNIEDIGLISYYKSKLPFNPWKRYKKSLYY